MNRWVVQRYTDAELWLRARGERMAERFEKRARESGQTSFEYLGIVVVIAVIIGVLAGTTNIGTKIKDAITGMIDKITAGSGK